MCGDQDRPGSLEWRGRAGGRIDRHVCGTTQHHPGKSAVGGIRDDQEIGASLAAVDGHHVLVFVLPALPVQIGRSLQWWPVDRDVENLTESGTKNHNEIGQLDADAIPMGPPSPVDVVTKLAHQTEPYGRGPASPY